MEKIITKTHNLIKDTDDLIVFEESVTRLMNETFSDLVSDVFTHLDQAMKEKDTHSNEHNDPVTIYFSFGAVTYNRTLIEDNMLNKSLYPLEKWLGFRPYQCYSPLVEVKAAELGSNSVFSKAASILSEWMPVDSFHTIVGVMVKEETKLKQKLIKG